MEGRLVPLSVSRCQFLRMPDNAEEYMMRVLHVISEITQLSLSDLGSTKHISCNPRSVRTIF